MTRTAMTACLFALATSAAVAQTNAGKPGGVSLDPGSSGGTAGLISGGGTVSSNLDARDNRPAPDARAGEQRKQAKTGSAAKEEQTASKTRSAATRARAEANDEERNGRAKNAKRQPRFFGYPYVYPNGFATFGTGYTRSRD